MQQRFKFGKLRPICPECGFIHFTDPKVVVVVFIEQDGRVLLVRRAMNPERGKWALPAGYVDAGEAPRSAAQREVMEETGLHVSITELIDVFGQNPVGVGASIVILFRAQVIAGEAAPNDDADAVGWFARSDALPPIAFESTHRLLTDWREQEP